MKLVLTILLALTVAIGAVGCGEVPAVSSGTKITKEKFEKLENGMTYEQVTEIVGGPGELTSEVGKKGEEHYTVSYSYPGEGSLGANAILMFQGNKLNTKAQTGLK